MSAHARKREDVCMMNQYLDSLSSYEGEVTIKLFIVYCLTVEYFKIDVK